MESIRLTLEHTGTGRAGDVYGTGTDHFRYRVLGLPVDEAAEILRSEGGWSVWREPGGKRPERFTSAEHACVWLEQRVNAELALERQKPEVTPE